MSSAPSTSGVGSRTVQPNPHSKNSNNNNSHASNSSKMVGEYVVTRKLGQGSFASVYKAHHYQYPERQVAIKAISRSKLNPKLQENLDLEIAILAKIDHPNIVRLYGIHRTERHIYLVMEYCNQGDLHRLIRRYRRLALHTSQHFLRDLAAGLKFLWSRNLIHRDLKPQNLLLCKDRRRRGGLTLKIADFGFARHLAEAKMAETLCGSPLYMAPEILRYQKYDGKADLWSVGTILFEMLVGRPPYQGANPYELLQNIESKSVEIPKSASLSRDCAHLIQRLLLRDPQRRIGFADFFSHPFVTQVIPPPPAQPHPQQQPSSSTAQTTAFAQIPTASSVGKAFVPIDGSSVDNSGPLVQTGANVGDTIRGASVEQQTQQQKPFAKTDTNRTATPLKAATTPPITASREYKTDNTVPTIAGEDTWHLVSPEDGNEFEEGGGLSQNPSRQTDKQSHAYTSSSSANTTTTTSTANTKLAATVQSAERRTNDNVTVTRGIATAINVSSSENGDTGMDQTVSMQPHTSSTIDPSETHVDPKPETAQATQTDEGNHIKNMNENERINAVHVVQEEPLTPLLTPVLMPTAASALEMHAAAERALAYAVCVGDRACKLADLSRKFTNCVVFEEINLTCVASIKTTTYATPTSTSQAPPLSSPSHASVASAETAASTVFVGASLESKVNPIVLIRRIPSSSSVSSSASAQRQHIDLETDMKGRLCGLALLVRACQILHSAVMAADDAVEASSHEGAIPNIAACMVASDLRDRFNSCVSNARKILRAGLTKGAAAPPAERIMYEAALQFARRAAEDEPQALRDLEGARGTGATTSGGGAAGEESAWRACVRRFRHSLMLLELLLVEPERLSPEDVVMVRGFVAMVTQRMGKLKKRVAEAENVRNDDAGKDAAPMISC